MVYNRDYILVGLDRKINFCSSARHTIGEILSSLVEDSLLRSFYFLSSIPLLKVTPARLSAARRPYLTILHLSTRYLPP